jgi:formamidopyrimidine-DNA glycosylase
MDQSVVSGIGNVYRAELLFRARQDPFATGRQVPEEVVRGLWRDWTRLLEIGYETGLMYTMDDEASGEKPEHWVYKRTGEPCLVCGTEIRMQELGGRKLYWCPTDQA